MAGIADILGEVGANTERSMADLFGLSGPVSRWVHQFANAVYTNEMPSAEDIVDAFRADRITDDECKAWIQALGVYGPREAGVRHEQDAGTIGYRKLWQSVWDNRVTVPLPGELIFLLQSNHLEHDAFVRMMAMNDCWSAQSRLLQQHLYNNKVPTPAEIIHYAVKDVWDENVVRDFHYDDEFPETFGYWMRVLGAAGDSRRRDANGNPIGNAIGWDRIAWRAHWENLSPSQAYEMYQRLRPSRIGRYQQVVPGIRPFEQPQLNRALLIADYPRTEREWLTAIAYNKPRLVDIRRLFLDGTIDRNECYELHLDYGYAPDDANMLTDWLVGQRVRANAPKPRVNPSSAALQLYSIGVSSRGETRNRLLAFLGGVSPNPDKPVDLSALPSSAQRQIGIAADRLLAQTDYQRSARRAKQILSTVRRRYLRGYLSEQEAREDLLRANFQQSAIDDYVQQWELELQGGKLLASTSQIKRYVADGVITIQTADVYLRNLGWRDPELGWLLSESELARQAAQARIAEKSARTLAAQAKAIEQQHRAAQRQTAAIQRRAAAQGTAQQIVRWYTHFVLDAKTAYNSLSSIWGDKTRAQRAIADATIARAAWGAKRGYLEGRVTQQQIQADQAALAAAVEAAQQIAAAVAGSSAIGTVRTP